MTWLLAVTHGAAAIRRGGPGASTPPGRSNRIEGRLHSGVRELLTVKSIVALPGGTRRASSRIHSLDKGWTLLRIGENSRYGSAVRRPRGGQAQGVACPARRRDPARRLRAGR